MGQKVNPHGARVGVIKNWDARWYANKKNFADLLMEDQKVRKFLKEKLYPAGISRIEIERFPSKIIIGIRAAKPGIIIGRGGAGIEALKKELEAMLPGKTVNINIFEIKNIDGDAQLVAESIAAQIEKRISFRRAMKQALTRANKAGVKGIKTMVSGRLGGADIARTEGYHEGSIPLQTLRADIEYGFAEAKTTYGRIGCKVWIYKGEVMPTKKRVTAEPKQEGGK
ncbi:MAG: 30S ribosomal protein S3 [Eubacteriales bacterium]|nr:30S ribosomal protein S3 [Eubacteriales bacterium]